MDDFEYNKSADSEINMCPWHFYARKFLGLKTKMNPYAKKGLDAERYYTEFLKGEVSFTDILQAEDIEDEIKNWVSKGIAMDPIPQEAYRDAIFQAHIHIDEKGKEVKKNGFAHGYLDILLPNFLEHCAVCIDVKTVFDDKKDDIVERHLYSLLTHAHTGKPEVHFVRFNIRHGSRLTWIYQFTDKGVAITGPDGLMHAHQAEEFEQPILSFCKRRWLDLLKVPEDPKPGEHCMSWYGTPCDFLGTDCPAAAPIQPVVAELAELNSTNLKAIVKGTLVLTEGSASQVYAAVQQMEGFLKALKDKVKDFSKECGPITVGDTRYGYHPTDVKSVDKTTALKHMVNFGMPIADIAKAIKMEASGLKEKSFEAYPGLWDEIQKTVSLKYTKQEFGVLE